MLGCTRSAYIVGELKIRIFVPVARMQVTLRTRITISKTLLAIKNETEIGTRYSPKSRGCDRRQAVYRKFCMMSRSTGTGNRTSCSKSDLGANNDNEVTGLQDFNEGSQKLGLNNGGIDTSSTNRALLISLESMRNPQHLGMQSLNLSQGNNRDIMNSYGTSLVQQYLQRQQRQDILEQNLIALRLEQLQHLQPSVQLRHEIPGLNQQVGTFPYSFASHNIPPFQLPYNLSPRENLLDMLMANTIDTSFPLQSNHVGTTSLATMNLLDGSSYLCDSSLRRIQQLRAAPAGITASTSNFASDQYAAAIAPFGGTGANPNNETSNSTVQGKNEPAPVRALSAYNFFFRYERERILNPKGNDNDVEIDVSHKHQEAMLKSHWNRDRTVKRRHRKSHGKISFSELSKRISQRWKELPQQQKSFFNEVAAKDWDRYHREIEQQKRKQS